MSLSEKSGWRNIKEQGRKLFDAKLGGSYEVFNKRPMLEEIREYCVQDVLFLPELWSVYSAKVNGTWTGKVRVETLARVALSQRADYNGSGRHMALSPWL